MHAVLQTGINQLEVSWISQSLYLEFGQVRVWMIAAGICGAQLMELDGTKQSGPLPHLMGHEGVGIVQRIGPGVTTVKEGDKVVLHWRKGDGIESDFPKYTFNGKQITSGKVVTWAEEVTVSENRVTRVDPDAPDELCVLLGCGLSTALGVIENEANATLGERVFIIGCGGLGLNLILAANLRRTHVGACDISESKKDIAENLGCIFWGKDWIPNFQHPGAPKWDVVIDTTGNEDAISAGISMLSSSGRFIMVGQPKGSFTIRNGIRLFDGDGQTIKATQGGGFRPHLDIPRYVNAWRAGAINLDGIITHRIGVNDIHHGIELVRKGEAGRILIKL